MYCSNCGKQQEENAKFCSTCGTQVSHIERVIVNQGENSVGGVFAILFGKQLKFLPIWLRLTASITIIMLALIGVTDGLSEDFLETFIGTVILSTIVAALVTFIILLIKRGYMFSPPAQAEPSEVQIAKYRGLSGWLTIVFLGLLVNLGFLGYTAITDIKIFNSDILEEISDPSFANHIPGYSGFLTFELFASLLLSLWGIYLMYLFFKTKKEFPKFYIGFLIGLLIYTIIEFGFVQGLPDQVRALMDSTDSQDNSLGRAILGAVVWSLYMLKSVRVKATFTN